MTMGRDDLAKQRRVLAASLLFAILGGAPAGAQDVVLEPRAPVTEEMPVMGQVDPAALRNLEEMLDVAVFNAVDEEVGEVEGYVVEGDRIAYARLSLGGFLGIGGSEIVVPFTLLSFRTARSAREEGGLEAVLSTVRTRDQLEALGRISPSVPQARAGEESR